MNHADVRAIGQIAGAFGPLYLIVWTLTRGEPCRRLAVALVLATVVTQWRDFTQGSAEGWQAEVDG